MESETKTIKNHHNSSKLEYVEEEESKQLRKDLDWAFEQHQRVKRLIDYFVLGLFLVFILYTVL
jgi:hypothetical protein